MSPQRSNMVRVRLAPVLIALLVVSMACQTAVDLPIVVSKDIREPIPNESTIEILYIANEGVLISSREKRVLIDGLHREYGRDYAFLPDKEREKIETAKPPFDNIDLIFVSHMHGDHFHPESAGLHLRNDPKSTLVSSQQIVDEIAKKFKDHEAVKARITAVPWTVKTRTTMKVAGIDVEFLGLSHGTGRHASIQNLGHVFTLGGKKLLHVGDAITTPENFAGFNLDEQNIDIAFLPSWYLTSEEGKALVNEHIKPKHIIAVHVSPFEAEAITKQVKQNFPSADVFTTMLEKRYF